MKPLFLMLLLSSPYFVSSVGPSHHAPFLSVDIVRNYTRPAGFIQGLAFSPPRRLRPGGNPVLFESTGLTGLSTLRKMILNDGTNVEFDAIQTIPKVDQLSLFGEDITIFRGHLVQLTYQAGFFLLYDQETLKLEEVIRYPIGNDVFTEGWGLTNDGTYLYVSDGTSIIYIVDVEREREPMERRGNNDNNLLDHGKIEFVEYDGGIIQVKNCTLKGKIHVRDGGSDVSGLNALTFDHKGHLWANVYGSTCLVCISLTTGTVEGWIHLNDSENIANNSVGVMNGVAAIPPMSSTRSRDLRLVITGKEWPKLYVLSVSFSKFENSRRTEVCKTTIPLRNFIY
eukprot:g5793.t1